MWRRRGGGKERENKQTNKGPFKEERNPKQHFMQNRKTSFANISIYDKKFCFVLFFKYELELYKLTHRFSESFQEYPKREINLKTVELKGTTKQSYFKCSMRGVWRGKGQFPKILNNSVLILTEIHGHFFFKFIPRLPLIWQ